MYPFRWTTQSALHFPPAHLFIPTPTRLLWEAFYPRSNYSRRIFTHISTTDLYSWMNRVSWRVRKWPDFKTAVRSGFEPGLSIASPTFYRWATALHNVCMYVCGCVCFCIHVCMWSTAAQRYYRTCNQVSLASNPPFATVSNIGHFRSLHWRPSSLRCINEYLARGTVVRSCRGSSVCSWDRAPVRPLGHAPVSSTSSLSSPSRIAASAAVASARSPNSAPSIWREDIGRAELMYDWATSHGRPPFCEYRVSPSG